MALAITVTVRKTPDIKSG